MRARDSSTHTMPAFRRQLILVAVAALGLAPSLDAQAVDPSLFQEMKWRLIGPFRASRTKAGTGVPAQPNVFYIGVVNGGVWKTTDYGRTWDPIFDQQGTGSIGAIAAAPSDPNIVYVGSGEGLQRPDLSTGDGIYKSTDAGKTWTHLGLRDGQQIPQIIVDPRDPNRLFVAALGHHYGPNAERGIFRSTDGGRTFTKVLYKDEYTSGNDVRIDPSDPNTVYATLWQQQQSFIEGQGFGGAGNGIFKSTDGGTTWKQLTEGLPSIIQANIALAPSNPRRLYATIAGVPNGGRGPATTTGVVGFYTSADGGDHWSLVINAARGAPGGDDYQKIWINPNDTKIVFTVADQGAVISANRGESWSNWYNQPTAAMYHVTTDNAFPYRVCGGQQDAGSGCVASRSMDGEITFHDWHPVNIQEYGIAAPDPKDPDLVFGSARTNVSLYNRRTGQSTNVGPSAVQRAGGFGRNVRTMPIAWSDR